MVKLVPDAMVHADHVAFRPWGEERTMPFVANGGNGGQAWVKLLSRDAETGAETLIYRLDQGWAASSIEDTVYENLLGETEPIQDVLFASYPVETPAVQAVKQGRFPQLPKRW